MRIGIFGGCFNPPHNMHKNIALELIRKSYVDKVIYVPTGDTYKKQDLISFKHRLEMLKLMTINEYDLLVSDIGNNMDYGYTYQVLDYFQKLYKEDEIYFICGSDNLNEFATWKNYKYMLEVYKLLVIKRNNDDMDLLLSKYKEYSKSIIITDLIECMLSSTLLREKISCSLDSEVLNYIDDNVYQYIKKSLLYKNI